MPEDFKLRPYNGPKASDNFSSCEWLWDGWHSPSDERSNHAHSNTEQEIWSHAAFISAAIAFTRYIIALLKGISAHSTRVGFNQDLFAVVEDLAGIMDALRWKSPRMPLAYNRNLATEQEAAGRLMAKLA